MAWYKTGTITVTNGSTTVTGIGTAWIANAGVGEALYAPDGRLYELVSIASNTAITIAPSYLGSTQATQNYVFVPSQSYIRDLAAQASDLVNSYSTIANTTGVGKFSDGTVSAPGIRYSDDLDTGFFRSASNEVTFVAGGVAQFKYNASGVSFVTGGALVGATSTQTLTNKTLTNPVITGGTITGITDLAVADGGTGASTASTARTNLGVTASGADTTYAFRANNLSDLASASTARTNLGLGTIATQNANAAAITGGSVNGTDVGASTASTGSFTTLLASGTSTLAAVNSGALVVTGTVTVTPAGNAAIELGRVDGVASTPFIDFHSGATAVDHDSRIIASGGTGTIGAGTLTYVSNTHNFNDAGINRAIINSTGLAVTGTVTSTTDATLSGVRVGKGAGAIVSNTAVGSGALNANTTGSSNTASGLNALLANTTGNNNTAIGRDALVNNTTGSSNTASGVNALRDNTTGIQNTASGVNTLVFNTTGNDNTANGVNVLFNNTTGSNNTAIGQAALQNNTTGNSNTASGRQALQNNTTGINNTALGAVALQGNTTGNFNTAVGEAAMLEATSGNDNVAVGRVALRFNTGSDNVAVGNYSLGTNTTGSQNTANGTSALNLNTTGSSNTASGVNALRANTTGSFNTASGVSALQSNTTGTSNTASGFQALVFNTTGIVNTAIGRDALLSNTTGSGNTAISPINSGGFYTPVFNPVTENNRFCMGSTGVTNAYIQVAWTVVSDARDKTNFAPVPHGLEFVKALQPTAYQFRTSRDSEETNGRVRYGFKAQDVLALEGANPVIVDNEDAEKLRMIDSHMIPVLVKAIQELSAEVDNLKQQLGALK